MGLGGVKDLCVGTRDGAPSTARSSDALRPRRMTVYWKYLRYATSTTISYTGSYIFSECRDLVKKFLSPDPERRIRLDDAMKHPWIASGKSLD